MQSIHPQIALILWVSAAFCQEEELHCRPKAGCHVSRCDPIPTGLDNGVGKLIDRNEFPILCKAKGKAESDSGVSSFISGMQNEITDLKKEILLIKSDNVKLKERLERLSQVSPSKSEDDCEQVYEGVLYNKTCLWAEDAPSSLTAGDALRVCEDKGAKLPDVYNKEEYDLIMPFLRSQIKSGQTHIFAWTGMQRDHSTGEAILSNGTPALYTKPRSYTPEWSEAYPTQTSVFLLVTSYELAADQGMGALSDEFAFTTQPKIVLCQKV